MATSGSAQYNQSVQETPAETIFDAVANGGGCSAFKIRCLSSSVVDLLVNVEGIHATGEFARVPSDNEEVFAAGKNDILKVTAKGLGGTATADYFIISRR
jgi:hypothetical protein